MSFERDPGSSEAVPSNAEPNIFTAIIPEIMSDQVGELNTRIRNMANYRRKDEDGALVPVVRRSFGDIDWMACALNDGGVILNRTVNYEANEPEIQELSFTPDMRFYRPDRPSRAMSATWLASGSSKRQLGVGNLKQIYSLALNSQPADTTEDGHSLMKEVLSSAKEFTLERAESILGDFEYYFPDSRLKRTARIAGGLMSKLTK